MYHCHADLIARVQAVSSRAHWPSGGRSRRRITRAGLPATTTYGSTSCTNGTACRVPRNRHAASLHAGFQMLMTASTQQQGQATTVCTSFFLAPGNVSQYRILRMTIYASRIADDTQSRRTWRKRDKLPTLVTTAPAPTTTPSPIVRPPFFGEITIAEPPNQQSLPMVMGCANSGPAREGAGRPCASLLLYI